MVNPVDETSTARNTAELWDLIGDSSTPYGDLTVVDRDNQLDVSADYPISEQRDITTAGVTRIDADSEIRIRANAGTESIETVEELIYSPGYIGEVGLAIRVPTAPTGDQEVRWGYWNDTNGAYFGYDADGVFVETLRGGSREGKVYEENWNAVDDPGFSAEKEIQNGTISRIILALYNYGNVGFELFARDEKTEKLKPTPTHFFNIDGQSTLGQQNLPLKMEVDNPDTTDFDAYVADRQATLRGQVTGNRRINGTRVTDFGLSGTTFVPVLSLRRKTDFNNIDVGIFDLAIKTTDDVYLQIRSDAGSTTDADYSTPTDVTASETALEVDTTPSGSISDGFFRFQTLIQGGTGSQSTLGQFNDVDLAIKRERPFTLFARTVSAAGGTISGLTFNWEENW